jgi:outer membrane protein
MCIAVNAGAQTAMTAEDAIRIGLRNNYDILIARNSATIAEKNAGKGVAGFLPRVDAIGNVSVAKSEQETNSPFSFGDSDTRSYSGQVTLDWTLFDGFRMFINKKMYDELAALGEVQARYQIENTVIAILAAYFNLVQQKQLLDVARNTVSISKARFEKEQVRKDLGGASSADFLNAQVSFNNDKAVALNQELQVLIARKELNILLAQDPNTEFLVDQKIEIEPLQDSMEELARMAGQRNSLLGIALKTKSLAEQHVKNARSVFFPMLSFNAGYGYSDRSITSKSPLFTDAIETQSREGSVGLTLTFNLFNGFQDKINYQVAKIEEKNSELEVQNTRNQITGLLQEKVLTFEKEMALVALEEQNVEAAEKNLALQQDRYNVGTASSLEFRDAQVNLTRAQTGLIVAKFLVKMTRLEVDQLTGKINVD